MWFVAKDSGWVELPMFGSVVAVAFVVIAVVVGLFAVSGVAVTVANVAFADESCFKSSELASKLVMIGSALFTSR